MIEETTLSVPGVRACANPLFEKLESGKAWKNNSVLNICCLCMYMWKQNHREDPEELHI